MKRIVRRLVLLLIAASLCAGAAAQQLVGRPIESVTIEGLADLAEESIRFYLELEEGRPWDPGRLNRNIKELWDRELVDDVSVSAEPEGDGVAVTVVIEERPILISIDYQGLKKLERSDISDHLDKSRVDVYEGLPLKKGELARMKQSIEELYSERGYRFAGVHIDSQPAGPSERRVIITIDEGGKVKIGRVDFDGNEIFSQGKLRRQMEKTKKSGLITRIRKRDIYNPATMEEDLEKVRELYRDFGYKDIEIGDPELDVTAKKPNAPTIKDQKRRLALVVPVEEGPRWKLGEILIEGNDVLNDDLLRRVFKEPKGGWLREDVIDEGLEQIREFYSNTGYIFARVKKEVVERDDLVADLVVTIDENDQYRIGRLEFEGNTRTRDRVLRRSMRVHEGNVFNSAALRTSLLRINQLEYFQIDEDEPVDIDYKNDEKQVNLTVKGTEAERTEVQFGGGYSELDGFFAQAGLRTRNFLGRGETLGLTIQTGAFRNIFDVSYFVPWLFDRPQTFGVQIFKRELDFDLLLDQRFVRNESGAVVTYGRSFRTWENLSLSYSNVDFEDFRSQSFFFSLDPEEVPQTFEQGFEFQRSSLGLNYVYDSHDSRLEPTRGKRIRAGLEYAGGFLGGESYFLRPTLNLAYTRPLTSKRLRTVGRINLELGYIEPFGEEDDGSARTLFFNDRYLLGGESSIRGYAFRSIWVRDPETGETITDINGFPQGGTKLFQLNLEYHFLTSGPFRVITFLDAGNVYGEHQDISLDHVRATAGIELRITVPVLGAPLRFIYASNLDPITANSSFDRERFESFDFSIGTSF